MLKKLCLLFLLFPLIGFSQIKTTGTPFINHYLKSAYKAGTQNWGIATDKNGFMYFANNDGLLSFDGTHWTTLEILQSSAVRSICIDKNDQIYVGSSNDFGIINTSATGEKEYQSLRYLLPPEIEFFDDIWRIFDTPMGIIFQSFEYVFILNNNQIEILEPRQKFHFAFYVNERLFLNEPGKGIFEYTKNGLQPLHGTEQLRDKEIWAILPLSSSSFLIGTAHKGIFKLENNLLEEWDTPANILIKQNKLYSAIALANSYFAFGTIRGGVIVTDAEGKVIQCIDQKNGLQNNTVLSIFENEGHDLWLGLDNGIDYVELTSPLTLISDFSALGTGYACQIFENNLYLGTNQGLFVKPFNQLSDSESAFELVSNTAGQVWSLHVFNEQLLCGHNLGAFIIHENNAKRIGNEEGAWKFIELVNHPGYLLGGYYNGLVLFKAGNNGWEYDKKVQGFNESSRYLYQSEDESIWISHGAKGVFRIELNASLDSVVQKNLYTSNNGLPNNVGNIVIKLNNEILISTINGIYGFNKSKSSFEPATKINDLFGISERIKTCQQDDEGNIWYVAENESGVIRLNEDKTYTKINAPFERINNNYVDEFEFIYPYNEENIFLGIENGFAHYSSKLPKSYQQPYQSFITKVELPYLDSVINFSRVSSMGNQYIFPFPKNSFRFNFTSNYFETSEGLVFSYYLENYAEKWSDWTSFAFKDYTNLSEGDYSFRVKAKNIYETESEISTFNFTINPPWYRSTLAWSLYLSLFLLISYLVIVVVMKRFQRAKAEEKGKHEQELRRKEELFEHQRLIDEKEIIRLRNEKLQNEMQHRDKELANQTMNLIQKNRSFIKLNEELLRIQNSTTDGLVKTKMVVLRKRIEKEIDDKHQNQIFETYFDEVHAEFFNKMREQFPELSPKELRLCAYIRMNLTTKELSVLLNISYRGAEIIRYRLRKKLDLSRDVNLATFLANI